MDHPTYEMVCRKDTGHAEVILVEFDPEKVSYEHLTELFMDMHSPRLHKPGWQYRSAIFTFDESQRVTAERVVERVKQTGEIVNTEITPATRFWMAEDYHQQYLEKRGMAGGACGVRK